MPRALLGSQLEILEPLGVDEPGTVVPTDAITDEIVAAILSLLEARGASA
jgi:gluconate kinase